MEEFDMFPPAVGKTVTQVLVTVFDAELAQESLKLATLLRQSGIRTEVYCRPARISAQIKYADTKGIPYAVILGSDEVEAGTVAIRDLASRDQQVVPREEFVGRIKQLSESR
jgi:histidyl-tRNA synthetase